MQPVGGNSYKFQRMDARMAFHVSRRLAPFMDGIMQAFRAGVEKVGDGGEAAQADMLMGSLKPVADALANMSDEQADYIMRNSLALVTRAGEGGGWSRVTAANGSMMFDDISMATMLTLVMFVLKAEFTDFFSELQSLSAAMRAEA